MNWEGLINAAAAVSWGSALIGGAKYVVGSSLFDIKQSSTQRQLAKNPFKRRIRRRPLVSVYILIDEDCQDIEKTLISLRRSGYRKYETIIIERFPVAEVSLKKALQSARGEFVLFLESNDLIAKNSLKNAVNHLKCNNLRLIAVASETAWNQDLNSVVCRLDSALLRSPSNKLNSLRGTHQFNTGMLYRKKELKKYQSISKLDSGLESLKRLLSTSWIALFGYFTYIAIAHKFPLLLGLFVLSAFVYAILMVLGQSGLSLSSKLSTIISLPAGLSLLLVTLLSKKFKKASRFFYESLFLVKRFKNS